MLETEFSPVLAPEQRLKLVARSLATALLRLHERAAMQSTLAPQNLSKISPSALEVPSETSVTVTPE